MIFVLTLLAAVAAPVPAPAPAPVPVPLGHMAGVAQAEGFDLNAMASGGGVGGFDANAASGGGDAAAFDAAVHQTGWERAITAETIAKARPWGASPLRNATGLAAAETVLRDVASAVAQGPAIFQQFCNSGDPDTDAREAAAFIANVLKETGDFHAFVESDAHVAELGEGAPPGSYCDAEAAAGAGAPCCVPGYGCDFRGRGAIQLTWSYNYAAFSKFYYGDREHFL